MNKAMGELRWYATDRSVTLFWEPAEDAPAGVNYTVLQNGETVGETGKTHWTLENLQADTEYCVAVRAQWPSELPAEDRVLSVRTRKSGNRKDVTKAPYGAIGDGETLNTQILQKAIDDCGADDVLYFPAGVYKTGSLRLHSNMEVYLDEGAVLQGTDRVEDYLPRILSRFEGTELSCYSSVLNLGELDRHSGANCENVLIHGKGTIASGGSVLAYRVIDAERERLKEYLQELGDKIKECENNDTIPGRVRPRLVNMSNCRNIILSGLTFCNGASWNVHMIYSRDIVTNNCTFRSEGVHNGDGWNPDSSENCTIFDCEFFTGDDSVAVKSGKNPEGNLVNRPSRKIRVFDCVSRYGHGVTIGSEMSGGVDDVRIWDCDLENSMFGIEIKGTKKRGGYVKNVRVRNCILPRVLFHSVGYNDDGIGAGVAPVFGGCRFEQIQLTGVYLDREKVWNDCAAVELCGFDEPGHELRDILFRDVVLGSEKASREQTLSLRLCENITFERIRCY